MILLGIHRTPFFLRLIGFKPRRRQMLKVQPPGRGLSVPAGYLYLDEAKA